MRAVLLIAPGDRWDGQVIATDPTTSAVYLQAASNKTATIQRLALAGEQYRVAVVPGVTPHLAAAVVATLTPDDLDRIRIPKETHA